MNQIAVVRRMSQCTIKPQHILEEFRKIHYLTPWDLSLLSIDYIQHGVIFTKPQTMSNTFVDHLKDSLSRTLNHFPSLSGCLVTKKNDEPHSCIIYLDCTDPKGAEFIHANTDLTISDVLSPNQDVPEIIDSFFAFGKAVVNYDGHTKPLLAVQVTELVDGIFIGCSLNHSIVDGTSFWHFFNTWAEICRENNDCNISRPPVINRWFVDGQAYSISLPFSHPHEFIEPYTAPPLSGRVFHFSTKSMAQLKAKANAEANTSKISSFQALTALVWRSFTRARNLAVDQQTCCKMAINDRPRLCPALSKDYFGACIEFIVGSATAGEILHNNLGWLASLLHEVVESHTDEKIRTWMEEWVKDPEVYRLQRFSDMPSILMGHSPRFDMYGNDFGWGKPLGIRCGQGNKFDGIVSSYPGREGEGSVDLDIGLSHEVMKSLLLDDEFMSAASSP